MMWPVIFFQVTGKIMGKMTELVSRRMQSICIILLIGLLFHICLVEADGKPPRTSTTLRPLTPDEIDIGLQSCPLVQSLNDQKRAENGSRSSFMQQVFAVLFPSSPAVNAILATLYISGPPNFLLALCPPSIDPSSLSVMVAFAVGGLLGDTLFHLLPEIFLGEDSSEHVRFVLVEPKRNLLLGLAIMVGFMTFVAMDKILRIVTGPEAHDHSHVHAQVHAEAPLKGYVEDSTGISSSISSEGQQEIENTIPRQRNAKFADTPNATVPQPTDGQAEPTIKLAAYLNLIADFTHNITDGLALSASFYTSHTIGATTTMAVLFHEIPHEVGDFALLIQSGFSKNTAMAAQFFTAFGAMLGTGIGIFIQEFGRSKSTTQAISIGLAGTTLQWGDLLLPFTAGTFLYVGTVAVIPEILRVDDRQTKSAEIQKTISQFVAVAAGAGIMLAISG